MSSNLSSDKLNTLLSLAPANLSNYEFGTFTVNENIGRHRQFRAVIQNILKLQSEEKILKQQLQSKHADGFADQYRWELAKVQDDIAVQTKWLEQFDEEVIHATLKNFEASEPEYWVHAVGTQAAVDIMTEGKMSEGTARKMMLMKKDDFAKTVIVATKISNQIKAMMQEAENSME